MKDGLRNFSGHAACLLALGGAAMGLLIYLAAAPNPWSTHDEVKVWGWFGGLAALAGAAVLFTTARWWLRPSMTTSAYHPSETPRWFWPLVAAAVLCTAVMGAMRLGHDFWADEELTVRMFVQGSYKPEPGAQDGSVIFKEFGAGRAFHHYALPNNHILHSVLARTSVSIWKLFRDPSGPPFSETATRVPAFVFGLLSLAASALLLKEMGFPRAGVISAFLLALHPWHLRMASEARGYSMILFFLPALLYCWLRALRSNHWKWWIGTGAMQFCILYTNPSVIFPVALVAILTPVVIVAGVPTANRVTALLRYSVSSFVGALLFILLFAPCLPQFYDYLEHSSRSLGSMGMRWALDFGSYLLSGMSWHQSRDPLGPHPELYKFAVRSPVIFTVLLTATVSLAVAGAIRAMRKGLLPSAVVVVLVLAPILAFALAKMRGWYLYEWYLVYALCGLEGFLAIGLESLAPPDSKGLTRFLPAAATATFLVGSLAMTRDIRSWVLSKSIEPMTESVLVTRPTTLPNYAGHSGVVTASFCQHPNLYDPHMVRLKKPDDLKALVAQCEADGRPLYLNVGGIVAAQANQPEMMRTMLDPSRFEIIARLPGWEPYSDRIVARLIPADRGENSLSPDPR